MVKRWWYTSAILIPALYPPNPAVTAFQFGRPSAGSTCRKSQAGTSAVNITPGIAKLYDKRFHTSLRPFTANKMAVSSETSSSPEKVPNSLGRAIFNAIGSTTSIVVSGTYFVVLAYQRDALMISFFIGSIANAIFGKILKRILNQERPAELSTVEMKLKPSDMGMPSSHAMSLGFIGTFTALTLPWAQLPVIAYSIVSLVYRVETKLHTWQQICVGFVVGSTNGAIWRHLVDGRNPWNINIMDYVSQSLLNEQGVLPWPYLAVPALIGIFVVGSVERRIQGWLDKLKKK